jgi:hypothetical protein
MRQHNGHVVQFAAKVLQHHFSIRALARDTSSHRLTHEQKGSGEQGGMSNTENDSKPNLQACIQRSHGKRCGLVGHANPY